MNIGLSQNRNVIAGGSIWLTAGTFMLAVYALHDHMPFPIAVVYRLAVVVGGGLVTWGTIEEKVQKRVCQSISN